MQNGLSQRVLFCFWTGSEEMSSARSRALEILQKASGVNVVLVTQDNLHDWLVPNDPLHAAYPFLSSTHKSDYLRSYFMLHYGGGYADIKPLAFSWQNAFRYLEQTEYDFVGAPEQRPEHVVGTAEMQANFSRFESNCAFIFRPGNSFAREWRMRVHAVLDAKLHDLTRHSGHYHPRAIKRGVHGPRWRLWQMIPRGYPLEWNEIMGRIFHKLQWERPEAYSLQLPPLKFGRYR